MLNTIALESLKHRRTSVMLTVLSIVISVSLLVGVEFIRGQIKQSFTRTVSGVDLIVGAPTGQLNLLLYSVFRIGNATQSIKWEQVEKLAAQPLVKWVIPIALGDSHKGFRVVGTDNRYFEHYQYAAQQPLRFARGGQFTTAYSAVVGAEAARELGYQPGDNIVISHGLGNVSFHQHDGLPFTVSGILAPTGTPVDKAVHVTLQGIEAVHQPASTPSLKKPIVNSPPTAQDTEHGHEHKHEHEHEHEQNADHLDKATTATGNAPHPKRVTSASTSHAAPPPARPESVTATLVGLTSRAAALQVQYQINQRSEVPMLAILPGMALSQLWSLMGNLEKLLLGVSGLILVASLIGLVTMLLASMRERRHEIAVLRAMGAGPLTLLWLIQFEALLVSALACGVAVTLDGVLFSVFASSLSENFGLFLSGSILTLHTGVIVALVLLATWLCSFIPAVAAYRQALHAGLSNR